MSLSTTEKFHLRLIGDRRKGRRLFLFTFMITWLAGSGLLYFIFSNPDLRFGCILLWFFACIPLVVHLFRMPCIVETSADWFSIETLRGAPMVPKMTQTLMWDEMYQYQYKGLYEHENNKIRPNKYNVGVVSLFIRNGDVFHFIGREAETFLGYLKRRFPDKQEYSY